MNDFSVIEKEFGDLSAYKTRLDYWPSRPQEAGGLLGSLKEGKIRTIGKSAGGRDIIAIEYGDKEPGEYTAANYMSALAGATVPPDPTAIFPESFFGKKRRRHPVIVLQGAIHGCEVSGTAASLNLCKIIETGTDLRGKSWPELRELAKATRLCIIPWLNPDGTSRFCISNPEGHGQLPSYELSCRLTHGVAKDGTKYEYPANKNFFPIPPEETAYMGCYFNDAGINLQYDFTSPRRQPETIAWMEYYLDERPDAVLNFHCDSGSIVMSGGPTVGHQTEISRLAGAVRSRLQRAQLAVPQRGRLSWDGLHPKPVLDQNGAIFYVCGATPVLVELPAAYAGSKASCSQILDIGLLTIEEALNYAHHDGMRPYEFYEKRPVA